ncbi:MAG: SDR family oxidoreductase, partial [Planktomarina temperata]|nr:SDR family oxidoreductase [Planktomarina temperata]
MGLMTGKRGLIMGLANDKSIAWGIAEALQAEGAQIGVTYVGDAMKKRVLPLAEQLNATIVAECDAGDPASIAALMKQAKEAWGQIDFIVHAIGFSDKSELRGQYINTSRDNFLMTMDISAYSFTAILQAAQGLLAPGASCLTMTYYGAEKVMPNYNVMGVA